MLTDAELEQLLLDLESDRAERKRDASNMDTIRKKTCHLTYNP